MIRFSENDDDGATRELEDDPRHDSFAFIKVEAMTERFLSAGNSLLAAYDRLTTLSNWTLVLEPIFRFRTEAPVAESRVLGSISLGPVRTSISAIISKVSEEGKSKYAPALRATCSST